jgi:hypothetical protein
LLKNLFPRPFRKFQMLGRPRKRTKTVQCGYDERAPAGLTTQMGLYQRPDVKYTSWEISRLSRELSIKYGIKTSK